MKIKLKNQAGNALLEFAFILPILLLIIAGIIDISLIFYDKAVITNASREGTRYGVIYRGTSYASLIAVQNHTQTYLANHLISFQNPPQAPTVIATSSANPPAFGATLKVEINYTYQSLLLHNFIGHTPFFDLGATTTMAYE
jgi:Flp pilus assembly protein TadG